MACTDVVKVRMKVSLFALAIMAMNASQLCAQTVVGDSAADLRSPVTTDARLDESASHGVVPLYPASERAAGHTAKVMVVVQVDKRGHVSSASVESSSPGNPVLEQSALDYARALRFFPATRNGRPVAAKVRIPVEFGR
jgi:TonB family protein